MVTNSLKNGDSGYEIDFEDLESKAKNESSKILILCNPHNPVGRVWSYEEISEIVKIAKKYNLMIISDEIHKDILLFNNSFYSLLRFDEYYENILVVTSEAKSFNLCSISDSLIITSNTIIAKKNKSYNDLRYFKCRNN